MRLPIQSSISDMPLSYSITNGQPAALDLPLLSIFDPDAKLPLNLARTSCSFQKASFTDTLLQDICRDFIAYMLVCAPTAPISQPQQHNAYQAFEYAGLTYKYGNGNVWFWCTEEGVSVSDLWFFHKLQPHRLFIVPYDVKENRPSGRLSAPEYVRLPEGTFPILGHKLEDQSRSNWLAFAGHPFYANPTSQFSGIGPTGMRMLLPTNRINCRRA
ncbi:MAG: hypothetical protein JWL77_481 [Chthonomonadaceae bacterium]|nr:hypothetical protein [Chthonomonadaceae bacterium]